MFKGFSQKASDFLWDLSFNNERAWFQEHKTEYEQYMLEPFRANAHEVYDIISERFPETGWQLHISRIYRDARRLYGKPPFKDHLWFTLWSDDIDKHGPAFWFELGKKDFSYGIGFWMTDAAVMEAYRSAIDANPAGFETMTKQILAKRDYMIIGEPYKRPKADRGEYLNNWYNRKYIGLEIYDDFGGDVLLPGLPGILADAFCELMPFYTFLCTLYKSTLKDGDAE